MLYRICFIFLFAVLSIPVHGQKTITLKPDSDIGIDARISLGGGDPVSHLTNYGNYPHIIAREWTTNLNPVTYRSLFDFDLSFLEPEDSIISASFNLYFGAGDWNEHHSEGVTNASWIRHVISPWEEDFVTWNNQPSTTTVDQVPLKASIHPHEDYLNIDLTTLIRKELKAPDRYHGFMLRLQREEIYNRLMFASSDHPDPRLHPELIISYFDLTTSSNNIDPDPIEFFPNPVHDQLLIEDDRDFESMSIYSVDGRKVHAGLLSSRAIDVSSLRPGMYIVQLTANDHTAWAQFIKV